MDNKEKGNYGEEQACRFLKKQGVRILTRNFGVRGGEIDLIGYHKGVLLFFEVKTRSGDSWGTPREAIDAKKMDRISVAADRFCKQYCKNGKIEVPLFPFLSGVSLRRSVRTRRIDGVEVFLTREGGLKAIERVESMRVLE